ncbi:MAG: DUF2330 domain-containing protein [Acidobacteriota bacterium]|nr:DUF2330 domain-containing protein [Acidobacteriota bacterium]
MQHRVVLPLIVAMACVRPLIACAPAPHAGEQIDVAEESAVIVWDPATRTQHFIRRATFRGSARDFGFLVPTPTEPTLAAVDDDIFDTLQAKIEPATIERTRRELRWSLLLGTFRLASTGDASTGASVEVLQTAKIAGYEAAVLDATDANALREWLETHGYATTPDLQEWLDVYIRQRWKITAFKIDKRQAPDAQTQAVKMSFTTDAPFFPYREPASQRTGSSNSMRVLRVFFLGPERVHGTIGTAFWPGLLRWSDVLDDPLRARLAKAVGVTIPARLTAFIEIGSRSGIDDLFFARSWCRAPFIRRHASRRTSRSSSFRSTSSRPFFSSDLFSTGAGVPAGHLSRNSEFRRHSWQANES